MAGETIRIQIRAVIWLFHVFMAKTARPALSARTCPTKSCQFYPEGKFTSYSQVPKYLLNSSATEDIIGKADSNTINFEQLLNCNAFEYWKAIWTNAPRFVPVYEEYRLQGTVIEGLHASIRQSIRSYFAKSKDATLQELAWHGFSLATLQSGSSSAKWTNSRSFKESQSNIERNIQCRNRLKPVEVFQLVRICPWFETLYAIQRLSRCVEFENEFIIDRLNGMCRIIPSMTSQYSRRRDAYILPNPTHSYELIIWIRVTVVSAPPKWTIRKLSPPKRDRKQWSKWGWSQLLPSPSKQR